MAYYYDGHRSFSASSGTATASPSSCTSPIQISMNKIQRHIQLKSTTSSSSDDQVEETVPVPPLFVASFPTEDPDPSNECQLSEQLRGVLEQLQLTYSNDQSNDSKQVNNLLQAMLDQLQSAEEAQLINEAQLLAQVDNDLQAVEEELWSLECTQHDLDWTETEAAVLIQSSWRKYSARCQHSVRKRMQAIQQHLDDMPKNTQCHIDDLQHSFEQQKQAINTKFQLSLNDLRRQETDHSVILAYLQINNSHLRIPRQKWRTKVAQLRRKNEDLKRENSVIEKYFTEVEDVCKRLQKENKSLTNAENKFRTQVQQKYKAQLFEQEKHLRTERHQNKTYKACVTRIIGHVARYEAKFASRKRRPGAKPIHFEFEGLVQTELG